MAVIIAFKCFLPKCTRCLHIWMNLFSILGVRCLVIPCNYYLNYKQWRLLFNSAAMNHSSVVSCKSVDRTSSTNCDVRKNNFTRNQGETQSCTIVPVGCPCKHYTPLPSSWTWRWLHGSSTCIPWKRMVPYFFQQHIGTTPDTFHGILLKWKVCTSRGNACSLPSQGTCLPPP